MPTYAVFVRNWWKKNPNWRNGLEPDHNAEKEYLGRDLTEQEAREMCAEYNASNDPGELSRKAEFEEE